MRSRETCRRRRKARAGIGPTATIWPASFARKASKAIGAHPSTCELIGSAALLRRRARPRFAFPSSLACAKAASPRPSPMCPNPRPNHNPMTSESPAARRRTFAIISHPDAGKTTLTEKILLFGGAIQLAGEVRAKANRRQTRSDWMGIERERGISVVTSVMTFEYADCVFNLLDTPGHEDFSEDTYRTLTAVDSAVMVIDAAKGIEARTRKLFEVCRLRDIPIVTFINKMDRETRDPFDLLDEIEKTLALDTAPLSWTVGRGRALAGAYDIRRKTVARARQGRRRNAGLRARRSRRRRAAARARAGRGDRRDDAGGRRLPAFRQAGVSRGASDAGAVWQRAQGIRRARPDRREWPNSRRRRARRTLRPAPCRPTSRR